MKFKYAIIGNSVASVAAIEAVRSKDSTGSLAVVAQEKHHAYSRPLITHYLAGEVDDARMLYRPESFYEQNGVETFLGYTVTGIDFDKKSLKTEGPNSIAEAIDFENLLIAVGGKPIFPPIKGNDRTGVFTMNTWDDAKTVKSYLSRVKRAVVLGGGLTGLKTAEALAEAGKEVVVIELADRVLSMALDAQTSEIMVELFAKHNTQVVTQNTIDEILGDDTGAVNAVVLKDGTKIDCEMVVVAIGVSPRTDLVKETPVEIRRGIVVDRHMRTTVPGVYAAGDVAEAYDFLLGAERLLPILPTAYGGGRIAGLNMVGRPEKFSWSTSANSVTFFGFPVVFAGFSTAGAEDGREVITTLQGDLYRKLVLKDNKLIGLIMTGKIDRAGILLGLMRDGHQFDSAGLEKITGALRLIDLPTEVRLAKLLGRNVA